MPIIRTTMIDDDGSGTTGTILNNAWLQTIYNQIDGVAGSTAVAWTPIDVSGAGLTFGGPSGYYVLIGRTVFFSVTFTFPTTSNGAQARIGGLPFACQGVHGGGYTTFGIGNQLHLPTGDTSFYLFNPSGAARSNAEMTGGTFIANGQYLA